MRRVATAAVGVPLVVLGICYAPDWLFASVIAVLAVLGFLELYRLGEARGIHLDRAMALPVCAALPFAWLLSVPTRLHLPLLTLAVLGVLSHVVFAKHPLEQALPAAGATLLGILWIGLCLSYFVAIRMRTHGAGVLFTLLLVVWVGDSGAYYVGRAFGRTKLAPRVSPGKTIAGLLGALATSVGATFLARALFDLPRTLSIPAAVAFGLIVGGVATVGDLAESALKRGAGVKDSGTLFPGHGGILDRLDSLLFAAPVMYYYFYGLAGADAHFL